MPARGGKPCVILLAEDDLADQELTRRALRESGVDAELRIVKDGEMSLDYLLRRNSFAGSGQAPRPNLILLDLNMPRLDGRQVLQYIRGHPQLRQIPVVVLTTSDREEDVACCYSLGCNSFITKPQDLNGLIQAVEGLKAYWFELVTLPLTRGEP